MANDIRVIEAGKYNLLLAQSLKQDELFEKPEWVDFVKTGTGKVRPNNDDEFWNKRAASILRQLYIKKIVGVNRMRVRYGNRKNRGMKPAEFRKGGGKIIRLILQQAEAAGFVEKVKGKRAGRQLTVKGREYLENIKLKEK